MRHHQRPLDAASGAVFYLDSKEEEVKLFQNSFEADVASCLNNLQLEIIELQANDLLRDKFKGEGL